MGTRSYGDVTVTNYTVRAHFSTQKRTSIATQASLSLSYKPLEKINDSVNYEATSTCPSFRAHPTTVAKIIEEETHFIDVLLFRDLVRRINTTKSSRSQQ